jgi:hypothetical protein
LPRCFLIWNPTWLKFKHSSANARCITAVERVNTEEFSRKVRIIAGWWFQTWILFSIIGP